jgi:hypothetical protein
LFWNHVNGIDYNPQLNRIMLSGRNNNEVFIIDHGTITAQASSHAGGRFSKGGDVLYRWGNPMITVAAPAQIASCTSSTIPTGLMPDTRGRQYPDLEQWYGAGLFIGR